MWLSTDGTARCAAQVGTAIGLGGLTLAQHYARRWALSLWLLSTQQVILFTPAFGALCALLYGAPAAPLGTSRACMRGFALVLTLSMALHWSSVLLAADADAPLLSPEAGRVVAPALGIAAMLALRQPVHPPAAACAVAYMQLARPELTFPHHREPVELLELL